MNYSFFTFFTVSRHIPGPVLGVSHFARCSVFLGIFQVLPCEFLIFLLFSVFSPCCRSYSVCVSFYTFFSFLAIIQVLQCIFHIFHVFHCFSPYSRFYSECVSYSNFLSLLSLFQFLPCEFLIFVCQFSRHMPGPTVYIYHFSCFSLFLAIFQVLPCEILIFLVY